MGCGKKTVKKSIDMVRVRVSQAWKTVKNNMTRLIKNKEWENYCEKLLKEDTQCNN